MSDRPIAIDLFCGAGGMSLGFEQAGFDVLASNDYDPVHCATHKFNFPDSRMFCKSVRDLKGDELRASSTIGDRDVAVICGGSPCQGYSMIGKRALDDPRNSLVLEFARIVREIKPRYFVFENVPGLTVGQHVKFLQEIIDEFTASGYQLLLPYRVLKAMEYGVPQDRRRLFLIGARAGETLPKYPSAFCYGGGLFPAGPTVWDAIGDMPEANDFEELLDSDSVKAEYGEGTEYSKRLRGLASDPSDFSHPRRTDPNRLTSSLRTVHTDISIERFSATKQGETETISRFLRLKEDGLCNTLRAGTAADRGAHTSPRPIHPRSPRCITVREAARLHSYPDWFRFHVTKWHGFRQVGNSVPPLLARAVAAEIAKAMDYRPVKPTALRSLGDETLLALDMSGAVDLLGLEEFVLPKRNREKKEKVSA